MDSSNNPKLPLATASWRNPAKLSIRIALARVCAFIKILKGCDNRMISLFPDVDCIDICCLGG